MGNKDSRRRRREEQDSIQTEIDLVRQLVAQGVFDVQNRYDETDEEKHQPLVITLEFVEQVSLTILNDQVDHLNRSILNRVCRKQDIPLDIVRALIKKGVDVHKPDQYGITPVMLAVWHNNRQIFDLLISRGANCSPTSFDYDGNTVLHLAIHKELDSEFVRAICDNGGDPLARNKKGKSCIDDARDQELVETAELLEQLVTPQKSANLIL
jgi:ankyrin repeat protein